MSGRTRDGNTSEDLLGFSPIAALELEDFLNDALDCSQLLRHELPVSEADPAHHLEHARHVLLVCLRGRAGLVIATGAGGLNAVKDGEIEGMAEDEAADRTYERRRLEQQREVKTEINADQLEENHIRMKRRSCIFRRR